MAYSEADWKATVGAHLTSDQFCGYNSGVLDSLKQALDWLKEWACSREFGLGTQLPWDRKWVIDSLSDSTVYMAYYTIAHYFHGNTDNMSGESNPYSISAADMTDDVFSYIFLRQPLPEGSHTRIPMMLLDQMRAEFEYWYPMDLRVSAKDLIPNHLTMCLYNHAEVWKDRPSMWPRGIYCNGHIMVDAEKMSKSKGNFLMMLECVEEFTADATRFALADAGDSLEDANFDRAVANQAVLSLFVEEEWIVSVMNDRMAGLLRTADSELQFMDRAFNNEIDYLVEATLAEFSKINFREGIHRCWYDMLIARDLYRDWSVRCNIPMHEKVVVRFIEAIASMILPVCPHWAENVWEITTKSGRKQPDTAAEEEEVPVFCATLCVRWPAFQAYDRLLRKQYLFFRDFMKNSRFAALKLKIGNPRAAHIYLATTYEPKKVIVLRYMQTLCDANGKFDPDTFVKTMKAFFESTEELKNDTKTLMQFAAFMREEAAERGLDALAAEMQFSQKAILEVSGWFEICATIVGRNVVAAMRRNLGCCTL